MYFDFFRTLKKLIINENSKNQNKYDENER